MFCVYHHFHIEAVFLYCCPDCLCCPANSVHMDYATWAIWAAIKKHRLTLLCFAVIWSLHWTTLCSCALTSVFLLVPSLAWLAICPFLKVWITWWAFPYRTTFLSGSTPVDPAWDAWGTTIYPYISVVVSVHLWYSSLFLSSTFVSSNSAFPCWILRTG